MTVFFSSRRTTSAQYLNISDALNLDPGPAYGNVAPLFRCLVDRVQTMWGGAWIGHFLPVLYLIGPVLENSYTWRLGLKGKV